MSMNANKNSGIATAISTNPLNVAKVGGSNAVANAPKMNAVAKVNANTPVNTLPVVGGRGKAKKNTKRGGSNTAVPNANTPVLPRTNVNAAPNAAPRVNTAPSTTPNANVPVANAPAVGGRGKKKGGALVDDLKNLAVPFAILLAKQGVENMYAKKKSASKSTPKSATPKRRATLAGGACATGCGMTGGRRGGSNAEQVKQNFSKIAADIDKFLAKY